MTKTHIKSAAYYTNAILLRQRTSYSKTQSKLETGSRIERPTHTGRDSATWRDFPFAKANKSVYNRKL